jgi:hypothetical protein
LGAEISHAAHRVLQVGEGLQNPVVLNRRIALQRRKLGQNQIRIRFQVGHAWNAAMGYEFVKLLPESLGDEGHRRVPKAQHLVEAKGEHLLCGVRPPFIPPW